MAPALHGYGDDARLMAAAAWSGYMAVAAERLYGDGRLERL